MELKEQLEEEEEDGDRQDGGRGRRKREKSNQRGAPMNMTVGDYECAQNFSHEVCGVITSCGTKMRVQS